MYRLVGLAFFTEEYFFSFHGLIVAEGILAGEWQHPYSLLHGRSLGNKALAASCLWNT